MKLRTAVEAVWDDVQDSVYQQGTLDEALRYAREEITPGELANVEIFNPGAYACYLVVRAASADDIAVVVAELT